MNSHATWLQSIVLQLYEPSRSATAHTLGSHKAVVEVIVRTAKAFARGPNRLGALGLVLSLVDRLEEDLAEVGR